METCYVSLPFEEQGASLRPVLKSTRSDILAIVVPTRRRATGFSSYKVHANKCARKYGYDFYRLWSQNGEIYGKRINLSTSPYLQISNTVELLGSCHKRQKPQAPTPQAPNRQTGKFANAKGINRNTNLT